MQKFVPILIILLIVLGIGGAFYFYQVQPYQIQPAITPTPSINQKNYVEGEINIGIKQGTKIKDAEDLVKSYNLTYKVSENFDLKNQKEIPYQPDDIVGERPVVFTVYVPKGQEQQWISTLSSSSIIKYAELNHYAYPASN